MPVDSDLRKRIRDLERENAELRLSFARNSCSPGSDHNALKSDLLATAGQLRERERDLRSILDNMPAMIGYWDAKLHNRFGNYAYHTWFGIDPNMMPGMHIRDVLGPDRYRLNRPYIEAALRGEHQSFERIIPSPDGKIIRHAQAFYIPDINDGVVQGFYVLVSDITALKETELALRRSEERYRSVIDGQTELICRLSADGRIIFANDVYCRFFGKKIEDIVDKKWHPAAHADDLADIEAQIRLISVDSPIVVIENRVYSGSGEVRWVQFVNHAFFDALGQLIEIQSVGRDITYRREVEAALRNTQEELESRVAARTEALRKLAVEATLAEERERRAIARDLHDDLGQVLHVSRIKLDALEKTLDDNGLAQVRSINGLITNASKLVRSLTSQLSPPVLSDLGLGPALRWLGEEMAANYGIRTQVVIQEAPIKLSSTQSAILFRAARELLINVSKHANSLAAKVELFVRDEYLHLIVEDNGKGMPDPAAIYSGNGRFGLASIRERILFLGGHMALESANGGGVRACLQMPMQQNQGENP